MKATIQVEIDGKYVTLSAPGCADCVAKVDDEGAIGHHVLDLARKAKVEEPRAEATREPEADGEGEASGEPNLIEALGDIFSIPEVQQGAKSIFNFLGSISTPRKEDKG